MSPRPRHASRQTSRATPVGSKATTPTTTSRQQARTNSGVVSHLRAKQPQTPAERWEADKAAVLDRFRAWMGERYEGEEGE